MGKTEITLGVVRTIKTAEFESLHVTAEVKEIVEWENEKEREERTNQVKDHLMSDFAKSYLTLTESIGVQRCLGTGRLVNKKEGTTKVGNVTTDDEIDIFD